MLGVGCDSSTLLPSSANYDCDEGLQRYYLLIDVPIVPQIPPRFNTEFQ